MKNDDYEAPVVSNKIPEKKHEPVNLNVEPDKFQTNEDQDLEVSENDRDKVSGPYRDENHWKIIKIRFEFREDKIIVDGSSKVVKPRSSRKYYFLELLGSTI